MEERKAKEKGNLRKEGRREGGREGRREGGMTYFMSPRSEAGQNPSLHSRVLCLGGGEGWREGGKERGKEREYEISIRALFVSKIRLFPSSPPSFPPSLPPSLPFYRMKAKRTLLLRLKSSASSTRVSRVSALSSLRAGGREGGREGAREGNEG